MREVSDGAISRQQHSSNSGLGASQRPPDTPPSASPEGESGRGLFLVDVLAACWGSSPRRPVGQTVWAEVSIGRAG
ncbi:hypothetical protein GCM10010365_10290 [Streptomyces poonensis]|uniref:ATP-binding protein n=1 Tax=Streptomyces poonensis TaxID=68255 RepID=A0A918PA54_9ACTN|nr:hypothetical protein GCM10010365_10290 [Streptomyces poonensis]